MARATINLNHIAPQNAHLALHDKGYGSYYFIGDHNRERNLAGSPLSMGPTELLSYRQWLWDKIQSQDSFMASALREVALATYIVHEDCAEIAVLIARAAASRNRRLREDVVQAECLNTTNRLYCVSDLSYRLQQR